MRVGPSERDRHLRFARRVTPLLLLAACALVLFLAPGKAHASPPIATPQGVGGLRLGASVGSLHRHHLIRRLQPGCELDPGQRVAALRPPLRGFAIFSHPNRRLSSLAITGGAETAKHIGIGSTPGEARSAYPGATYQPPGTADPFAEGFFWVNRIGSSRMVFVVDPETREIAAIDIPAPNFCE